MALKAIKRRLLISQVQLYTVVHLVGLTLINSTGTFISKFPKCIVSSGILCRMFYSPSQSWTWPRSQAAFQYMFLSLLRKLTHFSLTLDAMLEGPVYYDVNGTAERNINAAKFERVDAQLCFPSNDTIFRSSDFKSHLSVQFLTLASSKTQIRSFTTRTEATSHSWQYFRLA